MRPRDLFMGLRGSIGGARGSQGVERASRGSHGAIGLVWWVSSWFIRHICLYISDPHFSCGTGRTNQPKVVQEVLADLKRVKLGPGYNLTSIFVPNCISKDSQISSKHKPQNIGQISVLKSWPTPMLHVCTNLQHKKITRNSALISWPNFSFSTKLSFICSSSVATLTTVAASTSFQLAFLHIRVSSVKCGTDWQTRQCNDRTWIW